MLLPKKVKHRKHQKGRRRNLRNATQKNEVSFGIAGLQSAGHAWITSRQIEATRRVIVRSLRRGGKMWIRIFPDKPVTNHGGENTMGSGKGAVDHYVAVVKPGTVMFEIDGISEAEAISAMKAGGHKLPVKTKVVTKN